MDFKNESLDNLRSRIMNHSKFYYSTNGFTMEVFGMKVSRNSPNRNLNYEDVFSDLIKTSLINSFISNSEYLKKFLSLERRIENIKKLGI